LSGILSAVTVMSVLILPTTASFITLSLLFLSFYLFISFSLLFAKRVSETRFIYLYYSNKKYR
ncbi:hypothetical protein LI191_22885, partial [Phocaeicola dorei]|uniref:hypothetical protein n=1 Tax=Phocaeicola dorei TaxID=357276 RepID=UPI001D075A58